MSHIFVSYSRKDIDFAGKIVQALAEKSLDTWIDWKSIPKGEDWEQEIYQGIEGADAFLFLISPDSVRSEMCTKEIAHAVENRKRILPIVIRDAEVSNFTYETSRQEISKRNWIFCRDKQDDFTKAIGDTLNTIHTDYEWLKYHTKLQVQALEWERNNHENSFLLRGKELKDAELQLAINSSNEPLPTLLQRDHVFASRTATDKQRRILTGISIAGIIALAVLSVLSVIQARKATDAQETAESNLILAQTAQADTEFARQTAVVNEREAIRQATISRAGELSAEAVSQRNQKFDLSLLLSIESFRASDIPRAKSVLLENTQMAPQLVQYMRGHTSPVYSIAFSPDGKTLASGSNEAITLWDVTSRQPIDPPLQAHGSAVFSLAFSPDGKTLASGASGSADNTIVLWDVATRRPIDQAFQGHSGSVVSIAFSPDGKTLASGGSEGVILWDVASHPTIGEPLKMYDSLGNRIYVPVDSVAFSPDGKTLASGKGVAIDLWDVVTRQPIGEPLYGHRRPQEYYQAVIRVAFSPDGKTLASGSNDGLILWDVTTRLPIGQPLQEHRSTVLSLAFSPDGKTLASGSADNTIILWDVATRLPIGQPFQGHSQGVNSLAFSPDGTTLASGSGDNTIILWDVKSYQPIGQSLQGHSSFVLSVAFSPMVRLWLGEVTMAASCGMWLPASPSVNSSTSTAVL